MSSVDASKFMLFKHKMMNVSNSYEKRSSFMGYEDLIKEDKMSNKSHTIYDANAPSTIDPDEDLKNFAKTILTKKTPFIQSCRPLTTTNDITRCNPDSPDYFKFMAHTPVETPKTETVYKHDKSSCYSNTEISYK